MSVPKLFLLTLMIAVPATLRLVDVGWNAVPVGAVALFVGATFRNRWLALAVPVVAMLISDLALGWVRHDFMFYTFHPLLPVVYGCYLFSVCLGFGIRAQWNRLDGSWEPDVAITQVPRDEETAINAEWGPVWNQNEVESRDTVDVWNDDRSTDRGAVGMGDHSVGSRMLPVAIGTLAGALFFFVVTNFGDWLIYYKHTWADFVTCYVKALPFFRNTLLADTFGAIVLFGGYDVICRRAAVADPTGLLYTR